MFHAFSGSIWHSCLTLKLNPLTWTYIYHSGDNPSCSDGPPVTIDWAFDPKTQFVLDVDTFESMRGARRINKQLLIPRSAREKRYASVMPFCASVSCFVCCCLECIAECVCHEKTDWGLTSPSFYLLCDSASRGLVLPKVIWSLRSAKWERISTVAWFRLNKLEWIICTRRPKRSPRDWRRCLSSKHLSTKRISRWRAAQRRLPWVCLLRINSQVRIKIQVWKRGTQCPEYWLSKPKLWVDYGRCGWKQYLHTQRSFIVGCASMEALHILSYICIHINFWWPRLSFL